MSEATHSGETDTDANHGVEVVVVSNRGGLSFAFDDAGNLVSRRGAGGLVSALNPGVEAFGATWVAGALTPADREAAARGLVDEHGLRLRLLSIDDETYAAYYDVVANSTLWFLHHGLFARATQPLFDRAWREAWEAYRAVNDAFACAAADAAPPQAVVLVQDYHLSLVPARLREVRPDLTIVHFSHTPFCDPEDLRLLPDDVAAELLGGLAGAAACGFHTARWADAFSACASSVLGHSPPTFVAPAAPDLVDVRAVASSAACASAGRQLEASAGDRRLIVRVDRVELSKNLVRGFLAFDELLATHPEWRDQVVFVASVYPSREAVPEYRAYTAEVQAVVERVNSRWASPGWTPILFDSNDDFPASVAALARYDVLLVNPVRDGLNLVAKEGPAVNRRDGVLCLSRESGAFDELREGAVTLNPFDVSATADALHRALAMDPGERATRAAQLCDAAEQVTPTGWFASQVAAALAQRSGG